MAKICITGGAGYIGSHTLLLALEAGHEVLVLDSLELGYAEALERVREMSGREFEFLQLDLRDQSKLTRALVDFALEAVIHFAAYKNVGEAEQEPEKYFQNNVEATKNLLRAMLEAECPRIIFSSSAAVYGLVSREELPITETSPLNPLGVYGQTKLDMEKLIAKYCQEEGLVGLALRYFNAVGAHPSGRIGEDPRVVGNILPVMMRVLTGRQKQLTLFGDTFETRDGTQERDYVHVLDLARAHLLALEKDYSPKTFVALNLSTGQTTSCQELIDSVEKITEQPLPYVVGAPRAGDPEVLYASSAKAERELGWHAKLDIEQAITDQWRWTRQNPEGYADNY